MRKINSGFAFWFLMLSLPYSVCLHAEQITSVRDFAMGGANCALVENLESFSGNPAGLSGSSRFFFRETLNPTTAPDGGFLSQTVHLRPASWLGAGGSVKIMNNAVINAGNLGYAWHLQTTILRFFSLGIAEDLRGTDRDWRIGGIFSIPTRFLISRFGIGWLSRGFDFSKLDLEEARMDMGRDVTTGAHLQLTVSKECVINVTADALLVDDNRKFPLDRAPIRIGFEQILTIGGLRFSGRAGLRSAARGVPIRYSGGISTGWGLIDIDAGAEFSQEGTRWMAGATLLFGQEKPNQKLLPAPVIEADIPWTLKAKTDPDFNRVVILIEPPKDIKIVYWHLTVLDSGSIKVVKSFDNTGTPPLGFVFPYADLPAGKYRVDLSMLYDDGNKHLSKSETIYIRETALISQGGGE